MTNCEQRCDPCDWKDLDCPWREGGRREPIEPVNCPICGRRPVETINGDLQYQFVCRLVGESGMHVVSGDASSDRDEAAAMWNAYTEELTLVLEANMNLRIASEAAKNRHGAMGMG